MRLSTVSLPFVDLNILQDSNSQPISSDSAFLYQTIFNAYSNQERASSTKALELGTGNGIISIMLALSFRDWQISALEAQISQFILAKKNVRSSNTGVKILLGDLRKIDPAQVGRYDLVYANPPYYTPGKVRMSPAISRSLSRYELICDMDDLLLAVERSLDPKGKGFILYPASRTDEFRNKVAKTKLKIIKEIPDSSGTKKISISSGNTTRYERKLNTDKSLSVRAKTKKIFLVTGK